MAKTQVRYVCQECGRVSARQMGRCPQCGKFDTMVEEIIAPEPSAKHNRTQRGLSIQSKPLRLQEIEGGADERMPLSISEFARVLGGGIVPGSIVLVGGDPGIGKSTLLLQMTMWSDPAGDLLPVCPGYFHASHYYLCHQQCSPSWGALQSRAAPGKLAKSEGICF